MRTVDDQQPELRKDWPDATEFGKIGALVTPDGALVPDSATRDFLAWLAPSLRLRPTSRDAFLSRPAAASEQTLVVSSQALGRCSLDMLDAIQQRLTVRGLCLVFGHMVSKTTLEREPPDAAEHAVLVWAYFESQARRSGLELVALRRGTDPHGVMFALFRKTQSRPRWRLSVIHGTDSSRVRSLFDEVFAPNSMSSEHWEWKYGDGRGVAVGAWTQEELTAHYGGVWRLVWWDRKPIQAVQITDVMVSPRARGILRRDGAFSLAAASFPECFTGYGAKAVIGYGFPSERHFRAAALRGLYAEVDRIREISWPCDTGPGPEPECTVTTRLEPVSIDQLERHATHVERLWRAMHRSLGASIVGVRDWPYIRHRYVDNPLHEYRFVALRRRLTGRWLALAVLTEDGDDVHVRDLIGPRQQFPLLIARLRKIPMYTGRSLRAWITASHAHHLDRSSDCNRDIGIVVPHSIWTAGPSAGAVKNRWWLTSGDTDFL